MPGGTELAPSEGRQKVSVVVPTLNAGPGFASLLERLLSQRGNFDLEILVVDSGSTDGTVELAEGFGATVHHTPATEFDHGSTRDLGVSLAAGEYVALLVQDAVPADDRWLAAMVEDLEADPLVAGVYGRQVPRPDSSPLTRILTENMPTASPERREQFAGGYYAALSSEDRRALCVFDNVSSCLRRAAWEEAPFGRTGFGEDLRWAKGMLERGYKLVYEPRAAVVHSHDRGLLYDLRRHYAEGRLLVDLFGLAPVPDLVRFLWSVTLSSMHLWRRLLLDGRAGVGSVPAALGHAVASRLGLYLSARRKALPARLDAFLGRGI